MTGECDCCGKWSNSIRRVWYLNYMETYACAKCRQDEEETEHDDKLERETNQ